MCSEAMMRKDLFERCFKPDLLSLANDKVSNVRLLLAKVLRHHFLNQINGTFVFDMDVNDAVRLLKNDKSSDVRSYVEDIQTFPMNEDREVKMEEFLERMEQLKLKRVDSVTI
jgi:hypothetical protein